MLGRGGQDGRWWVKPGGGIGAGFRFSGDRGVFWKPQCLFLVAKPSQGGQEGVEGALSPIESLPGPFLKLPGWGGDHCGSELALSCSYPCQLAATSVSPTLTVPQDLSACYS